MPEDLKLSQIGSSPLPPPFRGLHSPGVRKRCEMIFACYFRKSSILAITVPLLCCCPVSVIDLLCHLDTGVRSGKGFCRLSSIRARVPHTHTHTHTHARTHAHTHTHTHTHARARAQTRTHTHAFTSIRSRFERDG